MKPFVFQHADDRWQGGTLLHVYIQISPERDPELAALVASAYNVLKDFPVTPVGMPDLHITLDQITGRHAADIPQHERDDLVSELSKRLARVEPFEVLVGSMLSYHSEVAA
jgi:hypothetical protein